MTQKSDKPVLLPRVVVLGGHGFLGRRLLNELAQAGIETLAPTSSELDLTQPEAAAQLAGLLREDDAVVFAACLTPDRGRGVDTQIRNVQMAEQVAAAIATKPCAHLAYISSDAVYADDLNPVRETAGAQPGSIYGTMHLMREQTMRDAAAAAGVPLATIRSSLLYGAGDPHNSYGPNRYVRMAQEDGVITLFGGGEEKRDHVYVDDAARFIVTCLQQRVEGIINMATGTSHSFMEAARLVASSAGTDVEIKCLPRDNHGPHRHFDTTLRLQLAPEFRFTPLAEGLAATFAKLKKEPATA